MPNIPNPSPTTNAAFMQANSIRKTEQNISAANWQPKQPEHTNQSAATIGKQIIGMAGGSVASLVGVPQISQATNAILNMSDGLSNPYRTLPLNNINKNFILGRTNVDFRTIPYIELNGKDPASISGLLPRRMDGLSAATRGSIKAGIMAGLNVIPYAGAYTVFNLSGLGKTGYGFGDHDNPNAYRADFTQKTNISKTWNVGENKFVPTTRPTEIIMPFRGDHVTAIDYGKRLLKDAYKWSDRNLTKNNKTQDFIKFFFTGPKLHAGNTTEEDDIITFRATISALSDSFRADWSPKKMVGRADSNYHYTGYGRDGSLSFSVYASDRDELPMIWRKLNALASYTAPIYNTNNIAPEAPWMRITVGDLWNQQPIVLQSVGYTLAGQDTTWEINIEEDPEMMQVPHKIDVTLQFVVITDWLPQKNGRFYSLAKSHNENGIPIQGNDNWLSEMAGNVAPLPIPNDELEESKSRGWLSIFGVKQSKTSGKIGG
jgi:hypothetical protein